MEESAPRDAVFFLCLFGFLGGMIAVVVTGALMRNWVRDNDDAFDPDNFRIVPIVGDVLLLFWSMGRYAMLRRASSLPLALGCLAGALAATSSAVVLELR